MASRVFWQNTIITFAPLNFQKTQKPLMKNIFCFLKIKIAIIPDKDSEKTKQPNFPGLQSRTGS